MRKQLEELRSQLFQDIDRCLCCEDDIPCQSCFTMARVIGSLNHILKSDAIDSTATVLEY